jgi:hypothetical protein
LQWVSATSGLEWAPALVVATLGVRAMMIPLGVKMTKNATKLYNIMPETKIHVDRMNKCACPAPCHGTAVVQTRLADAFCAGVHHVPRVLGEVYLWAQSLFVCVVGPDLGGFCFNLSTLGKEEKNEAGAMEESKKVFAIYKREGVNPLLSLGLLAVQMPVFIGFFLSIRRMCEVPLESMQLGGFPQDWWSQLGACW